METLLDVMLWCPPDVIWHNCVACCVSLVSKLKVYMWHCKFDRFLVHKLYISPDCCRFFFQWTIFHAKWTLHIEEDLGPSHHAPGVGKQWHAWDLQPVSEAWRIVYVNERYGPQHTLSGNSLDSYNMALFWGIILWACLRAPLMGNSMISYNMGLFMRYEVFTPVGTLHGKLQTGPVSRHFFWKDGTPLLGNSMASYVQMLGLVCNLVWSACSASCHTLALKGKCMTKKCGCGWRIFPLFFFCFPHPARIRYWGGCKMPNTCLGLNGYCIVSCLHPPNKHCVSVQVTPLPISGAGGAGPK